MSDATPELADIIRAMTRANRRTMFGGWMPGRIEKIDSVKMKADVQLLIEEPYEDENGSGFKPLAVLTDVPVQTIGDGTGIRIEVSLSKGDYVTVLFASRSTDEWMQQGGMVTPRHDRDHDLSDAVCFPGLFDFAHVRKPTARIKFTATAIEAGGTNSLAKKSELDTLKAAISGADTTTVATFKASIIAALTGWPSGTSVLKGG